MLKKISNKRHAKNVDDIDIFRIFSLLLHNKWRIAFVIISFSMVGMAYALFATPIYRADALVQIEDAAPTMNPLSEMNDMLGKEPPTQSEIGVIRSRMVLGRAVDILNLDILVEPKKLPVIGEILHRIGIEPPKTTSDWGIVWGRGTLKVGAMQVNEGYLGQPFILTVLDDNTYVISSEGETLAQGKVGKSEELLNGGVTLTIEGISAIPGSIFELTRIDRMRAIQALKNNISIAEQGKNTGILNLGMLSSSPELAKKILSAITDIYIAQNIQRQSQEARNSLNFLKGQIPNVQDELSRSEGLLNNYRKKQDSVDLTLETQSILERLVNIDAQLNELEFTESEISRRFTLSHPTYEALIEKKQQLQKEKLNLENKISSLPETQQEILRLQRDVAVNQDIYVQLRNKVQEMQIAEASTVGNVRILDQAAVFPTPVAPNKKIIVSLATLIGVIIAVGLVLLRAAFNRGIETASEIEELEIPVYAIVPLSKEQEKYSRRIGKKGERRTVVTGILAQRNSADVSVEALRGLRTSLHFAMLSSSKNRLMITGPSPGIGKSFISVNLALVCAQAGQRVLIIDGDMRRGHMHRIFNDRCNSGLSELLSGTKILEEVVRPVKNIDKLDYIARGVAPPNPSELLMNNTFKVLLEKVSQLYDLVIIDSPPVLAVTDATVIGKQVDITLMVARFHLTSPREVNAAIQRLKSAKVNVTGAVFNAVDYSLSFEYNYMYYNQAYG